MDRGDVDAGLIIHEGQLTYSEFNLIKVVDLGQWWYSQCELPLPLGGNVIRKDLGQPLMKQVTKLLQDAIVYSLQHRQEALDYALTFAREMGRDLGERCDRRDRNSVQLARFDDAHIISLCTLCAGAGDPLAPPWVNWSPDQRFLYAAWEGNRYALPVQRDRGVPTRLMAGRPLSLAELVKLPDARLVGPRGAFVGSTPDVFAFTKVTTQRNIYRVPVP